MIEGMVNSRLCSDSSSVKTVTLLVIFWTLLTIPLVAGVDKVSALSQFNAAATVVVGQSSLSGCPVVQNEGSYQTGYQYPMSGSFVYGNKLVVTSANTNEVKIYNNIPTTNNTAPDVVLGRKDACAGSLSVYFANPSIDTLRVSSNTFFDGTHFFIVDSYNHRVLIYNNGIPTVTGATPDLVIGQPNMNSNTANNGGIGASTLNYPYDIWSDGTKLLISDQSNNRILIFNNIPTSNFASADVVIGQLDMTSNSPGTTATTLRTVRGIDSDGTKLYVADYGNHRVLVYNTIPTTNGASADIVIGQPDLTSGTVNNGGLSANTYNNPVEVQVKNGKMFVGDRANCRALIYNSIPTSNNASADVVIGQPNMTSNTCNNGGVSASSLGTTYGVVSSGTKLFVTDYTNNRILIFNSIPTVNGASADVVLGQATMTGSGFFGSTGIVTASNFYNVQGMDTDGTKLFINDYQNFRVLIYNAIPTTSGAIPDVVVGQTDLVSATSGITASKIRGAFHAIGSTILNKLFVSDGQNNRVLIFNAIPTTHGASADIVIGQADMVSSTANAGGLSAKSLNANKGVYVDAVANKLIIADASNHRVLIFNTIPTSNNASADVVIGQPNMTSNTANNGGIGPNTLNAPYGVYYDGAKLFITDWGNNRVLIFNSLPTSNNASADIVVGQPSMTSNTKNNGGVGANTLFYPRGVHSDGIRLFIADQSNHRVLIYNTIPTSNGASADAVVGQSSMSGNFGGSSSSKIVGTSDVNVAGNRLLVSDILNDRVLIFPLGPQNGGASVAPIVSNTNVTMTLSADDAKDVMVSENSDLSGASWQSFSASLPFTLSSGDGVKTVYVKYRDYVNYEGSVLSATTTLDTVAPTGTLAINAGSTLTKTKEVTLALASADSGQMKISNASDFDVASWETYAATKAHTLTTPDGLKTVYVKYKDAAGNESETYTATIALDTTKPVTKITDIGLITNVPDKTPLFYYFTSQTPRIKGTTEALSIVHFTYDGNDYTTTANGSGNYEIDIPELPRQYVELTYYAIDPAGNQGTNRLLKLMIGVENFPAELLPQDEETVTPTETPADGTPIPTPSETPTETIQVFGIQVTDQNGNPLAETAVYIDGQRYVTDKNGKIYIEKQPTEDMTLEVEINGQRIKGTVMGEKIVVEIPAETAKKSAGWYWWVLGVAFVGVSGYAYSRRKR